MVFLRAHHWIRLPTIVFWLCFLLVRLLSARVAAQPPESVQGAPGAPLLTQDRSAEGELAGAQLRSYQLSLFADQFLHLAIEDSLDSPVLVTLWRPDGMKLREASNRSAPAEFSILFIAPESGNYTFTVQLLDQTSVKASYRIEARELRAATSADTIRVAANEALTRARQLSSQDAIDARVQAMAEYQKAISLFHSAADQGGEAFALEVFGLSWWADERYEEGLGYLKQATLIWHDLGEFRQEARAREGVAAFYGALGKPEDTLANLNQELLLYRAIGDRAGEAKVLEGIGETYDGLGEFQNGLKSLYEARSIYQALSQRAGEYDTLWNLGTVYEELGEYQRALDLYDQALALARSEKNRTWEADMLQLAAGAHAAAGENDKAVEHLNLSLATWHELGNRWGEAFVQGKLASFYIGQHDYQKSLKVLNQLLPLYESEPRHHMGQASTLHRLGVVYNRLGMKEKALENLQRALGLWPFKKDREARSIEYEIGLVYENSGDHAEALRYYGQTLSEAQSGKDPLWEAFALAGLARSERALERFAEARSQIEENLQLLQSLRPHLADPELRAMYFGMAKSSYEFYIDLLMQMHLQRPEKGLDGVALQASEASRARSLLDMLAEARMDIRQGVDPGLVKKDMALDLRLGALEERQARLLGPPHTAGQAEELAEEIRHLVQEKGEAEAEIRLASPHYAALTQPQPLDLQQIQAKVVDPGSLLLEYSLGEEHSYLWVVGKSSIASFQLPRRKEIEAAARQVHGLLTAWGAHPKDETLRQRGLRLARAKRDYCDAAAGLSRMILGPAVGLLGTKRLLIVADGGLQYVPFGPLPDPGAACAAEESFIPLLVQHEVVNLPSASVVAVMRGESTQPQEVRRAVAVLADPVFDRDDERVAERRSQVKTQGGDPPLNLAHLHRAVAEVGLARGAQIPRLPFSRREAHAIAALLPADQVFEAIDFQASLATAISPRLDEYRVIHFATHTLLDSSTPELSGIILSLVDRKGHPQNGFLRLHEIYNLKLSADVVVLSACQTALGKEVRGEGLLGLVRGFMYTGVRRVVASLWEVNDAATAELMARFYKAMLKEQLRPAAALRVAQIQMWRQKRWQNPYYWAAFELQGEWN